MAKIYISYQREDQSFAMELARRLKDSGHDITFDLESVSVGTEWRSTLDKGLRSSEIFIVVVSQNTLRSQYVLAEIGAARAYSLESGRMMIVPIAIDDSPMPVSLQDISGLFQPDRNLEQILPKVEAAISTFIGRRAAKNAAAMEAAEKIQRNAADYINVAIDSLARLEVRDRWLGYLWYATGFAALVLGIAFSTWNHSLIDQPDSLQSGRLAIIALKAILVIALLGACAKYAFSLGRSYASEALKCSDRIHAIRFGEFYLRAFGDKTRWEELKEVFQHWNIDRASTFSSLDASSFDPKLLESTLDFLKSLQSGKGAK